MIIGFTGKMGVGKTTACDFLISKHPFERRSFKSPLIAEIKRNFPRLLLDLAEHYGVSIDALFTQKPPMVRHLLQEYGTEVRRGDDQNYWVKEWKKTVSGDTLADDVRFLNEAEAIREFGGIIIKLERDGTTQGSHASETEMDLIEPDVVIKAASIADLHRELSRVVFAQDELDPE